jgi:hypothetical protein
VRESLDLAAIQPADAPQIDLSKNELARLATKLRHDYASALSDHEQRMRRFQAYYMRWRNRTEPPEVGEEATPNFRVPILQWQIFAKWAKEHSALFGADAEILAKAIGPDDQKRVRKVGLYMTWRAFSSLKVMNAAAIFNFRKICFGRSHAYSGWVRKCFYVPMADGTEKECVSYDGPGFEPLWPDDFIVPGEDVDSLHDFSFVMRKNRQTPDQLLRGEDQGRFQNIRKNFELIYNSASDRRRRDFDSERVKSEKDMAEGVTYEGSLSAGNTLVVHEWYGKWRKLKGRQDAREDNLAMRGEFESDLLVKYLPDLDLIVGVQDLAQMYPYTAKRRPFVEAALVQDGSYWGPSFGELLENIELELSTNHNIASAASQFAVGPVIFYKPASGFDPNSFVYRPNSAIACEDPNGVKVIEFKADLQPAVLRNQELLGYSERTTGLTDQNMGRTQDRPNAPRTARQSLALLEEGDVRASLDTSVLREHWGEIVTHWWELEQMYGSPNTFFRVTEQDAGGLFPVARGGATMDETDMAGSYDFDLRFATSAASKEQNKQNQLALYQIDLQNPLVVNNPKALWLVLDKIHKAFGDDRFSDVIPEPPDIGMPLKPVEEWTRALEHEDLNVNPLDNDQFHIADHERRIQDAQRDPTHIDPAAVRAMEMHIQDHIMSMRQKAYMAALTSRLAQSLNDGTGGLSMGGAPMPIANLHAQLGQLVEPQEQPGIPAKKAA